MNWLVNSWIKATTHARIFLILPPIIYKMQIENHAVSYIYASSKLDEVASFNILFGA